MVDSCEHFANITGKKNCKKQSETDEVMSDLILELKIFTQFFAPKTYLANDMTLSPDISYQRMQLSPIAYNRITYTVAQTKVSFKNSYIYNFASAGGIKEVVYSVVYSFSNVFLPTMRDMTTMSPYDSPLSVQFTQAQN